MLLQARARGSSSLYAAEVLSSFVGVEVGDMDQPAVGETPHARGPFVPGVVGLEVFPLQRPVPLSADERPRKEDPDVLFGVAAAEHHAAAVRAAGRRR